MNKKEMGHFKKLLLAEKDRLLEHSSQTRHEDLTLSVDDLHDEVDQASTERSQNLTLQLRDREIGLLHKIEAALHKIEEGTYGICEACDEAIEGKRLEARPFANLCVACKEEEESDKRAHAA